MKKGMLITSSSLPAGDTEIHHHSMLRWAEFPYLPWVSPEATCSMDITNSTSIRLGQGGTLCKGLARWESAREANLSWD